MILVGIAFIFVLAAAGAFLDAKAFLVNLLVAAISIVVSVAVALSLVDRYVRRQKSEQWAKVRETTYHAIIAHLADLTSQMFIYFPVKDHRPMSAILEGRSSPSASAPAGMDELATALEGLPNSIGGDKSTSDLAVEWYEAVKWDLDQIREVLTPRVMQFSTDQEPVDALIQFDEADRDLENAIIAHKQVVTHSVFRHVTELLRRAKVLYDVVTDHWGAG